MKKLHVFDLDGTLLPVDSGDTWPLYLAREEPELCGWAEAVSRDFAENEARGFFDPVAFALFNLKLLSLVPRKRLEVLREDFIEGFILPKVSEKAFEIVRKAKEEGAYTLQISGTVAFVSAEIGRRLGIDRALGVEPARGLDGDFTARMAAPVTFGVHKVKRLENFLRARGLRAENLEDLRFYTDSDYDLPLIQYVREKGGRAFALNPNARLEAFAKDNALDVIRFY